MIDVRVDDKMQRRGGSLLTQSDLLIVNKTDLAKTVGEGLVWIS